MKVEPPGPGQELQLDHGVTSTYLSSLCACMIWCGASGQTQSLTHGKLMSGHRDIPNLLEASLVFSQSHTEISANPHVEVDLELLFLCLQNPPMPEEDRIST